MRGMVAVLLAAVWMPVAASAQEWHAYNYPDPGFTIQFPTAPAVESGRVKNATGASLPITRYSVRQEHLVFTLSVVNYGSTNADPLSTINTAERSWRASGSVTAASGVRIARHVGRELRLTGADGSNSTVAIFFVDKHLYTAVAQAVPPIVSDESTDALRFLKGLQFSDDGGGFFGFFGGSNSSDSGNSAFAVPAPAPAPTPAPAPVVAPAAAPTVAAPLARKAPPDPHADATCLGKLTGDVVQLQTASGPVTAICTLVARPVVAPGTTPTP